MNLKKSFDFGVSTEALVTNFGIIDSDKGLPLSDTQIRRFSDEFPEGDFNNIRVLAYENDHYNAIGWVLGRRQWLDPGEITYHYQQYSAKSLSKNKDSCEKGIQCYVGSLEGIAPDKNIFNFEFSDSLSELPSEVSDGTIALYFVEGKGFTHTARYVEGIDRWTSKLGNFGALISHELKDLAGQMYGQVLCYLTVKDYNVDGEL